MVAAVKEMEEMMAASAGVAVEAVVMVQLKGAAGMVAEEEAVVAVQVVALMLASPLRSRCPIPCLAQYRRFAPEQRESAAPAHRNTSACRSNLHVARATARLIRHCHLGQLLPRADIERPASCVAWAVGVASDAALCSAL